MQWRFWRKAQTGHVLGEDDRQASLEKRRQLRELDRIRYEMEKARLDRQLEEERAALADFRADLSDTKDDAEEPMDMQSMMMMLLLKQFGGGLGVPTAASAPLPTTAPAPALIHYTDEQIDALIAQVPKVQRAMIRAAPADLIEAKMREMFNADDDSIDRAIAKLTS